MMSSFVVTSLLYPSFSSEGVTQMRVGAEWSQAGVLSRSAGRVGQDWKGGGVKGPSPGGTAIFGVGYSTYSHPSSCLQPAEALGPAGAGQWEESRPTLFRVALRDRL